MAGDANAKLVTEELVEKLADRLARSPTHEAIRTLSTAGRKARCLGRASFKKMTAFLLDEGGGRDRREPWTTRPGDARPVPVLRLAMQECYGIYGDVHWFNLNKAVNRSDRPLLGLFPRMAASTARVRAADFGTVVDALLSSTPDAAVLRMLQKRGGRIPGIGLGLFSRLAFAHRPDLYFTAPRPWADESGFARYVGRDLRRYCELCRNLRVVCDDLGLPAATRAGVLDHLLRLPRPPAPVLCAIHKAIGPSLARYQALDPVEASETGQGLADPDAMPSVFAARAMRARRGGRALRQALLKLNGDRCVLSGACVRDLLEVAYVLPYPTAAGVSTQRALLMRSDVHTLFDLNLIGIEAETRRVQVAPKLAGTTYAKLAGRVVQLSDGVELDDGALRERWRMFVQAHPDAATLPDLPSAIGRSETRVRHGTDAMTGEAAPPVVETSPLRERSWPRVAPSR